MSAPTALPTFQVEDRTFTRLILGHNPFLGYSYLSNARSREYEARFSQFEPLRDVFLAALGAGVRSVMISTSHPRNDLLEQAITAAQEQTGIEMSNLVIVTPDVAEHVDFLRRVNCQVCLIHGQTTDSFFQRAQRTFAPGFSELTAAIRAAGCVPGMSSHNGGETVPLADNYDVAVVNTPVNKIAWRMCPCVEEVLGAIRRTSRKVIAMKSLAMGRIAPPEAMDYVFSVPGVSGVVVGIGTPAEAEETFALGAEALARAAQ